MSVEETTRLDMVYRDRNGRMGLSMTESRFYAYGDAEAMAAQLVAKVNSYVGLIRSGRLAEVVGQPIGPGVDVLLTCMDEPPPHVRQIAALAARELEADGAGFELRVLPPQTEADTLGMLRPLLEREAPDGTQRIELVVTLVGRGMTGHCTAFDAAGSSTLLPPADWLIESVQHLKRALQDPARGTFTTVSAELTPGSFQPDYDWGPPPRGTGEFPQRDWDLEAGWFPRHPLPDWWPRAAAPAPAASTKRRGWFGRGR